jgi:hypothetical protein
MALTQSVVVVSGRLERGCGSPRDGVATRADVLERVRDERDRSRGVALGGGDRAVHDAHVRG